MPYGGITGLTYGNGLSLTHGYDNQYRTSSIIVGSVMNRTYDYDSNGNITSNIDSIQPPGNETLDDQGAYTYQQATNKLTQIEGELNVIYGHDANGNITSANNRTFTYDLSNRLIMVQDDGVTIAEYVYNALNQRMEKILPTSTRIFHYDFSGHLIAETNETGQVLAEYVYLGDEPLAMLRPSEALYYYHNDHLGTPQILTDDTGTISWKAVYTPFGEAVISVETVENPFRFPGQYYDQETGLHYNWNRYYDPKTGRYLTPDPIGLEGGINLFVYVDSVGKPHFEPNLYTYTRNNPVNQLDPQGLQVAIPLPHPIYIIPVVIWIMYDPIKVIVKDIVKACEYQQSERERCHKVWEGCREECSSILPTPRMDQGNPFHKCVIKCLEDNDCLGKLI